METCWLCDVRPIEMLRRPLCNLCYSLCRNGNVLHIFPKIGGDASSRIIAKHGNIIISEMESLRAGETTLAKVGDSHGLTRERIRQIYKLYWGEKYTVTVTTRAERREKEKEEEKREYGLFENRVNRAKKNCSTYTGIVAENLFKDKCESLGYDVKMMNGHYLYDAEVNGIPVDVKSRTESAIYVKCKSNQKYYHFRTTDKQRAAVKFYPFLLFDEGSWYIIPVEILGKGRTFFVPKYDITYSGKNRYKELQKYREAWHLLAGSLDTT